MKIPNLKKASHLLAAPLVGAIVGILYGLFDETAYQNLLGHYPPKAVTVFWEFTDIFLPAVVGILVGCGINILRRQNRLNKQLSMQNTQLERDILITTLISEFLHEIRNPIHNLTAALEDNQQNLSKEQREIIQRNLQRFEKITTQYKKWNSIFDSINPRETVELRPWLGNFVDDKIRTRLQELNIHYSQDIEPVKIHMHPALLEQSFITLFGNALEALNSAAGKRTLSLSAKNTHQEGKCKVMIKMTNSGILFPEEVLKVQGRSPVTSRTGTGFGLLLLRKMIEQTHGDMALANEDEKAVVTLYIPGEAA